MEICKRNVTSYSNGRLERRKKSCLLFFVAVLRVLGKKGFSMRCMRILSCRIFTVAHSKIRFARSSFASSKEWTYDENWKQRESIIRCLCVRIWNWDGLYFMVRGCKRPLLNHMLTMSTQWKQKPAGCLWFWWLWIWKILYTVRSIVTAKITTTTTTPKIRKRTGKSARKIWILPPLQKCVNDVFLTIR